MRVSSASALLVFITAAVAAAWGPSQSWGPGHGNWTGPPGGYGPPITHNASFIPDHVLRLTYENVSIGWQSRTSVLFNGTTPGPERRLKAGKTSWIRVYNDMADYNATVHWHGLSQREAIFSDGKPSASQWPIAPLHFFDYEVHPLPDDAGSHFYHSHVGFQAVSATRPLIVRDDGPPPYAYDKERIVHFMDYFNETDSVIEAGLVNSTFTWSGETNAVLTNGVGVSVGETAGVDGSDSPVIYVDPGKTYRMRFVGSTSLSMVQLAIVAHDNFTIVGADGQYTKPHTESYMQVSSGQRFEVIFQAKSSSELGNETDYLIQFETKDRALVYYGYGVLRYSNTTASIATAPATPPIPLSNATYAWLEYALEPLTSNNFPSVSEVTRRVTVYDRQILTHTDIWRLNGLQWNSAIPNYGAVLNNSGGDPVTYTWPAKLGEVLEMIWVNTGSLVKDNGGVDYHPFHAHGGHYYDIGSGSGSYDSVANEEKLKTYNPVLRDTTNLYRYTDETIAGISAGWRGWRLRVSVPGVWMNDCHILQHMIMGMQSVWVMGDYEQIARIPHYGAAPYLDFGGSAYGNETFAPSSVRQLGD